MKKIVSIFVSLVILLTMGITAFGADIGNDLPINTFPTNDNIEKIIEEEKPANEAYDQIIEKLGIVLPSEPDYPNYPDNYGGAYYKDKKLHICLTDTSKDVTETYALMVTNPEVLEYELVDNSYNNLYRTVLLLAQNRKATFSSISVDVINNTVEVGIPFKRDDELFARSKKQIIDAIDTESRIDISFIEEDQASEAATELIGGQKICWGSSTGTMTICGTWQGNAAVLSAGHCVTVGTTYKHLSTSGNTLGTGSYRRYDMDQFYDYGVITLPSGYSSTFTTTNKVFNNTNYTTITSKLTSSSGLVGTTVCKYGYRRQFGVATINKVDAIVSYTNGPLLYGMSKATFTSGTGYKGDSGGPIYSGHKLYGIYSGDDSNPDDATYFWYSPIYGAAGFTIKTS